MAIEVSQNEEISGEGKNGGRKEVGSAIRQRRAKWGRINIKKKEREKESFRDMLTST